MKDVICFGVFLMRRFERDTSSAKFGKAISEAIAKYIVEYCGERNLSILEEELKNNA